MFRLSSAAVLAIGVAWSAGLAAEQAQPPTLLEVAEQISTAGIPDGASSLEVTLASKSKASAILSRRSMLSNGPEVATTVCGRELTERAVKAVTELTAKHGLAFLKMGTGCETFTMFGDGLTNPVAADLVSGVLTMLHGAKPGDSVKVKERKGK